MPDAKTGRLLVTITPGQTRVEGIVNADPDLVAIAGTVKEAKVIFVDDVGKLETAIVEAVQSGKKVADGYVKFAQPVVINGPTQITVGGVTKEAATPDRLGDSKPPYTIDDCGLSSILEAPFRGVDDEELTKLAACDFVENWLRKAELDKVDGNEVGLTVPVKVAFNDDKAKEWFLSLFKKKAGTKAASTDSLAERLVAAGTKKAAAVEKIISKMGKRRR